MKKETKEKIRLTVKEILLAFYDGIVTMEDIFVYPWQRKNIRKYQRWREIDKNNFYHAIWQLEKQGYINRYKENKKNLLKLTKIGTKKALRYILNEKQIAKPKNWDKKWRIIIFDIPKDKSTLRDIVRNKLKYWGFHQLQKSVFVYPFDCREEIASLKYLYGLEKYLQYIVAETIEAELDLVNIFFDQGTITHKTQ